MFASELPLDTDAAQDIADEPMGQTLDEGDPDRDFFETELPQLGSSGMSSSAGTRQSSSSGVLRSASSLPQEEEEEEEEQQQQQHQQEEQQQQEEQEEQLQHRHQQHQRSPAPSTQSSQVATEEEEDDYHSETQKKLTFPRRVEGQICEWVVANPCLYDKGDKHFRNKQKVNINFLFWAVN